MGLRRLGKALKKVVSFERENLRHIGSGIKDDPSRLLKGAIDPFGSKLWGYENGLVNQLGGATDEAYLRAKSRGIDTRPGRALHDVAGVVAGVLGGGALVNAGRAALTGRSVAAAGGAGTAGNIGPGLGPSAAALPAGVGGGSMALSGLDWANIGTSILGLLVAKEAGDIQADAAGTAAAGLERADLRARADLEPFRQAGGAALNPLLDFAATGPETELERAEGFTNIQNSAAAGGKLRSGGTLKALTEFNSMLNSRNRGQRFNELFNLATLGSNAASRQGTNTLNTASGVGEYATQGGNARAGGLVGGINSLNNGLDQFAFLRALGLGN